MHIDILLYFHQKLDTLAIFMYNISMKTLNFEKLHKARKAFLKANANKNFEVIDGNIPVLISAPHGVTQVRNGKHKVAEIGSLAVALQLQKETKSLMIAKTKNCFDDANWDELSPYKQKVLELVRRNNIRYVIDFHGLATKREMDVNLGTHLGHNIETNTGIFDDLIWQLRKNKFVVTIDNPFAGGSKTIAGNTKNTFEDIWTLQIEINARLTNSAKNFEKLETLLSSLTEWIKGLK